MKQILGTAARQGRPCTLSLRRWATAGDWAFEEGWRLAVGGHGGKVGDGGGEEEERMGEYSSWL